MTKIMKLNEAGLVTFILITCSLAFFWMHSVGDNISQTSTEVIFVEQVSALFNNPYTGFAAMVFGAIGN